jgi:DNA repair protein RecO (recombination protein O)
MIESATGLILRTRPLTETSLIVCWLTPELGRLSTVAKGARGPKSSYRGKLDLFYLADFTFSRSRRSELHTLRELGLKETHGALRRDLGRLRQAAYAAALIEQATETETPLPTIFELLSGLLAHLSTDGAQTHTQLAFELKLLAELGLQPDLKQTKLSPASRALAQAFVEYDWAALSKFEPGSAQLRELNQFLHGFVVHHLGRIPKGRETALVGHG